MIIFDPGSAAKEIKELELKASKPDFWSDREKALEVTTHLSDLKERVEEWNRLNELYEEAEVMLQLYEEGEKESKKALEEALKKLDEELEEAEIRSLFWEPFDIKDAILAIHAGAGGTEACDWVEMLARMYSRWAEKHGYQVETADYLAGEEAGLKNITLIVKGKYAYGHLKSEKGVHRLVRISPFDFNRRRHTSFASVDVIPAIGEEIKVEIDPKDLKIETFRASGPGGQHVNVTDSAVRITHLPTGLTAQCQSERSQFQNREKAMEILKSKLFEYQKKLREEEMEKIKGEKKEIAWGSQIRSYVLHPYNLVKDHRTDLEEPRAEAVLDGMLSHFMLAFLRKEAKEKAR